MDSYKQEEIIPKKAEEQNSLVKMDNPEVYNLVENQSTGVKPKKVVQFKDNENNNNKEFVTDVNDLRKEGNFLHFSMAEQKTLIEDSESEIVTKSTPTKKIADYNEEIEIELIGLFKPGQQFAQHLVSKPIRPSTPALLTENYYKWDQKIEPEFDNDEHILIDLLCDELAETSIE